MGYATLAAGTDRGRDHYIIGVFNRLHCQSGAGVACVGLQWDAGQCSGTDLPAVQPAVGFGGRAGHHPG